MTTTPKQLQAWREEFEKTPTKGEFGFELLGTFYARNGEYRNRALADEFKGYLRRCQETEQLMKLAKFGAMVAHFQFNKDGCSEACIQDTADECGLFLNGSDEFSPNTEAAIKELLK